MTTIMSTPSVRIGTKLTRMTDIMADINITRSYRSDKKCINGTSVEGLRWMRTNLMDADKGPVHVDAESINETIEKIKLAGLTVEER